MPGTVDPGGTGDPYITRLDGQTFYFNGVPGKLHRLYERGDMRVHPRILPIEEYEGKTYFSGVDLAFGDVKVVVIGGQVHIFADGYHWEIETKVCSLDAPGHEGCTTQEPHPLMGVPHANIYCRKCPDDRQGEGGLIVDGTPDSDPATYVVSEPTPTGEA